MHATQCNAMYTRKESACIEIFNIWTYSTDESYTQGNARVETIHTANTISCQSYHSTINSTKM